MINYIFRNSPVIRFLCLCCCLSIFSSIGTAKAEEIRVMGANVSLASYVEPSYSDAQYWWLYVGHSAYTSSLFNSNLLTEPSASVPYLDADHGEQLYLTIFYRMTTTSAWQSTVVPMTATINVFRLLTPATSGLAILQLDLASFGGSLVDWWVVAGSGVPGPQATIYFNSGLLSEPDDYVGLGGMENLLITGLPMDGSEIIITAWYRLSAGSPWKKRIFQTTAPYGASPLGPISGKNGSLYYRDLFALGWLIEPGSSWYQVWVNGPSGDVLHNRWYRHSEICSGNWETPISCTVGDYYPLGSTWWVRGWNQFSGAGSWGQSDPTSYWYEDFGFGQWNINEPRDNYISLLR